MLTEDSKANLDAFKARKVDQVARAIASMPNLQIIKSGEGGSQIAIGLASQAVAEAVVIGQLAHIHIERVGSLKNPVRRDAPNERKPPEKQAIDLTDAQIDAVIDAWRAGKSALGLPGVQWVYDRNGRIKGV